MEMKFFLDYAPEETSLIDPSLLSKFRTMRLADTNVLDLLIAKTVEIALEKGVIASKNKLIVDARAFEPMQGSAQKRICA